MKAIHIVFYNNILPTYQGHQGTEMDGGGLDSYKIR